MVAENTRHQRAAMRLQPAKPTTGNSEIGS
jgi:hypothetical protein